jgi:hypothetical protein
MARNITLILFCSILACGFISFDAAQQVIEIPTQDVSAQPVRSNELTNTEEVLSGVESLNDTYPDIVYRIVHIGGDGYYFSNASGVQIELINNYNSVYPSYRHLLNFLENDTTDNIQYNNESFVCGDFAWRLHNNAEAAGIRCGLVAIKFTDSSAHSCNAFLTTDRGLIGVDCTGTTQETERNHDTIIKLKRGEEYDRKDLFFDQQWGHYGYYGIVKNYHIYW